ncbi:MAG: thioredoxin [Propionibacteriaceae bacterium]|nr:thioredoxin [Micropruina sp.]HBX79906.1 thioredoxin [Propionibacteriaceae bacterium]
MAEVVTCPSCSQRVRVPASAKGNPRCPHCKAPLPWVVNGDDENFADVSARGAVLVDLWAPWCPPCRMVAPHLVSLAGEKAGSLKVVKINVDDAPRTQSRFGAQSIPTLVLLKDGREVARQVGAVGLPQLRRWVDSSLAK